MKLLLKYLLLPLVILIAIKAIAAFYAKPQWFDRMLHSPKHELRVLISGYDAKEATSYQIGKGLKALREAKNRASLEFDSELNRTLVSLFEAPHSRVKDYANWFYGYKTQYRLMYEGFKGVIDNYRGGLNGKSLSQAASQQIEAAVGAKYLAIVVKPYRFNGALRQNIQRLLKRHIANKEQLFNNLSADFEQFLKTNPYALSDAEIEGLRVQWSQSQSEAASLSELKEKSGLGGVGVVGGVALLSKPLLAPFAKALSGKLLAKVGLEKLIASAAAKIAAAPLSMGASLALGFGVDYGINQADRALFEKDFIRDTHANLYNIQQQLYQQIIAQKIIAQLYARDIALYEHFLQLQTGANNASRR